MQRFSSKSFRIVRWIGGTLVAAFLMASWTPISIVIARTVAVPPDLHQADAIVIVGGAMHSDGSLNEMSLRATIEGMKLYRKGFAPRIVFLGTVSEKRMPSEAAVRSNLAKDFRIPSDAITLEEGARTTREECYAAA